MGLGPLEVVASREESGGSSADLTVGSNGRPSGRCDTGGHWVPAEGSTSWLGPPQAGDPWGASSLSVVTHRRYFKVCAARAFQDRVFAKKSEESPGGPPTTER